MCIFQEIMCSLMLTSSAGNSQNNFCLKLIKTIQRKLIVKKNEKDLQIGKNLDLTNKIFRYNCTKIYS